MTSFRVAYPGISVAAPAARRAAADGHAGAALRWLRLAVLALLAGATSGCASYLTAQVTSFHEVQRDRLAGRSFVITPSREQAESLEFRSYADLVRGALVRQGLVAAPGGDAELVVTMRYFIDNGKAVVYGYPAYGYAGYGPVWGWAPYYGYGPGVHYTWAAAYPVGYGYTQTMLYRRELRVEIDDRRAAAGQGSQGGKANGGGGRGRLFEGSVVTEGESASLAPVMPAMVHALFSDFPGPSGVSRRVEVLLDHAPPPAAAPPAN
jgi:hypothetical protein